MRRALVLLLMVALAGFGLGHAIPANADSTPSPTTTTPTPSGTPPTPPAGSSTIPAPSRTPWPSPANLRVTTVSRLLDEAGRPLPPEQQEHTDVLTWDHTPGSNGQYNIEVTLVPLSGGPATVLQPYILFPADRGNGTINRISQYPEWLNYQRCYRIRITVPSGTGGIEVGPFGEPACTLRPPVSGPGTPPAPPDTGNGAHDHRPASVLILLGATISAAAGLASLVGMTAGRRPRNR